MNERLEKRCQELIEELRTKDLKINGENETNNSKDYARKGSQGFEEQTGPLKSLSVKAERPVQVYSQIPLGRNQIPAELMADDLKKYEQENRHKYVPRDLSRKNMNLQDGIDKDIKYALFMK
jgi:hypothetical protein